MSKVSLCPCINQHPLTTRPQSNPDHHKGGPCNATSEPHLMSEQNVEDEEELQVKYFWQKTDTLCHITQLGKCKNM